MALDAGVFRVTHQIPADNFNGPKLGDIRMTCSLELFRNPGVVAYLWAGDTVMLREEYSTPMVLRAGEVRFFVHLPFDNSPFPQAGSATYSPDAIDT